MKLFKLNNLLNELLGIEKIKDASLNGIQVEGSSEIENIAFAVDINDGIIDKAIEDNIDCIVVHHGMFWGSNYRIKGYVKKWIKKLLENDITLYAIHLPLDIDDSIGNNAYLFNKLKLKNPEPLIEIGSNSIGLIGEYENKIEINEFFNIVRMEFGEIKNKIIKNDTIEKVAVLSGDPKSFIGDIQHKDFDLLLSGELTHQIYFPIKNINKSFIFIGHFLSEVGGIILLKNFLEKKYSNEFNKLFIYKIDSNL